MKVMSMHRSRFITILIAAMVFGSTANLLLAADSNNAAEAQPTVEPAAKSPQQPALAKGAGPEAPRPADAPLPAAQLAQNTDSSEPHAKEPQQMAESTDATQQKVFQAFRKRFPDLAIDSIAEGPYPGLYEVITDSQIVYVDEEITLLFQGEMINLTDGVNLTEARLAGIHMGLINDLGEQNMLVYDGVNEGGATESDRAITVFTDIDCGYCRLLHSEIDTLLQAGISVRYLMFPRAGLESDSRKALESVWCADNPQEAMTAAKAGQPVAEKVCETPVETHYELAGKVGLRGTPLIYLDNGTALPGYREASAIVEMINSSEPMAN